MKAICFTLAVSLLAGGAASAKPAWDISSKWLCRATSGVQCNEQSGCSRFQPTAVNVIDFEAGTVRHFGLADASPIQSRRYLDKVQGGGISYFSAGAGQFTAIIDEPKSGILEDGRTFPEKTTTIYGDNQTIIYGECRPQQ